MSKLNRAKKAFDDRRPWEALWDVVYRFLAPERATIFQQSSQGRNPNEVGAEVFDATAIDDAERLANLIVARLCPPWSRFLRIRPVQGMPRAQREQHAQTLRAIEDKLFEVLPHTRFYEELQPVLVDRIVGGTAGWAAYDTADGLRFNTTPLADLAQLEDYSGRVVYRVHRADWRVEDLERRFPGKLPRELDELEDKTSATKTVYHETALAADGNWENRYLLDMNDGVELETSTEVFPDLYTTRWSRVPGTPYGRGPGLRALSDVRAVNKIKELTLKNAAKAVAGVYTAWHDGVLNPHTIGFEPGTVIPVASNNLQDPPIAELPNTARFDISQWSMSELQAGIKRTFMADQFGSLERTPRSSREVAERTSILAQDLGSSISAFLHEFVLPSLERVLQWMFDNELVEGDMALLDPSITEMKIVSYLARGQQQEEARTYLEYASIVAEFGQIDPQAGLVLDIHKALRRVGELEGIHPEDLRSMDEIQQLMQQSAQAQMGAAVAAGEQEPQQGGQQ